MGIETHAGDVYRLILALDVRVVVAVDNHYRQFEEAQAQVAETVCRYARTGRVRAVALQRGHRNGRSSHPGLLPETTDQTNGYTWTIEKQWGPEVIIRILTQNGIELPTTEAPRLNGNSTNNKSNGASRPPAPNATEAAPSAPHSTSAAPSRHKNMRWQVCASIIAVICAMIGLILFQTDGHPGRFFSAIMGCGTSVKNELPFDARTSFDSSTQTQNTHDTPSNQ